MVRRDGDGSERAAQGKAAGVAHEDGSRRRVEPQEGEARADDGQQQHRQVADAEDVRDAEIFGEARVADQIGDQQEGDRRDDHRHGRQPVEPIGQVHRIAERDDHECPERDVEPAKVRSTGPCMNGM